MVLPRPSARTEISKRKKPSDGDDSLTSPPVKKRAPKMENGIVSFFIYIPRNSEVEHQINIHFLGKEF